MGCRATPIFRSIRAYESGGVVVFNGFRISEGLQDGVGLQQLLFQLPLAEKTQQSSCKAKRRTEDEPGLVHAGTAKRRREQARRATKAAASKITSADHKGEHKRRVGLLETAALS